MMSKALDIAAFNPMYNLDSWLFHQSVHPVLFLALRSRFQTAFEFLHDPTQPLPSSIWCFAISLVQIDDPGTVNFEAAVWSWLPRRLRRASCENRGLITYKILRLRDLGDVGRILSEYKGIVSNYLRWWVHNDIHLDSKECILSKTQPDKYGKWRPATYSQWFVVQ